MPVEESSPGDGDLAVTERARRSPVRTRLLAAVAIAILVVQLVVVVGAVSGAPWWFSWGPNDYLYQYRIDTTVSGRPLDAAAIERRYGVAADGIFEDPIEGLLGIVRSYESTYGRHDHARVVVHYRLDNGREQTWKLGAS
jgi:hypothetical protein